jgi:hypothetical protein
VTDEFLDPPEDALDPRVELLLERHQRRASRYVPTSLHPKQEVFVELDALEALFGGAAGGGKSEALLAGALRDVDKPGYSAIIFRRTYTALALKGAIMDRAAEWLGGTDAKWSDRDRRWTFPSGAVLQFGFCDNEGDLERYKSAEFQYLAIDELTEWPEKWYTFLFSRVRRKRGVDIELRVRGATNPDGIGQEWVRERFGIPLNEIVNEPIWTDCDRVFIPARAEDNPALDLESYERSLRNLSTAKYEQLRWGRWIRDLGGMVYQLDLGRHTVEDAPKCDYFVLGIDYGFTDSTAFCVFGWREHDPCVYVLESFKQKGLTPSEAAQKTRSLETQYRFHRIVGDIGGLGKGYAEEARRRFHLPIMPAEKNNKRGYIDLLNGDLLAGRLKVVGHRNRDLVAEMSSLPWSEDRSKPEEGFEDHLCDAMLYGWRACQAYHEQLPAAPLSEDEKQAEYERKLKDARFAEVAERIKREERRFGRVGAHAASRWRR